MEYTKNSYKIYSCVVSALKMTIQNTINNVTYGYTILGDKILKYVFDTSTINLQGCFINENTPINFKKLSSNLNEHNNSTVVSKICAKSKLKLIDLWNGGIEGTHNMVQKFAIKGPFKVKIDDKSTYIYGNKYIVDENTDILSFNNDSSFLGLNKKECTTQYIRDFIFNYPMEEIRGIKHKSLALDQYLIGDHETHPILYDNTDNNHNYTKLYVIFGIVCTAVLGMIGYKVYAHCKQLSKDSYEKADTEQGLTEININTSEEITHIAGDTSDHHNDVS